VKTHILTNDMLFPSQIRPTMSRFPRTNAVKAKMGCPLGLVITPLAGVTKNPEDMAPRDPEDKENDEVALVEVGEVR
jgi:hypothetical protein